jgi:hypothetical protein
MEPPPQLPVGDAGNMTVSWRRRLARVSSAAGGVISMVIVLLIAGIGFVLAGLLAVIFGMPVKEFSFGNTLILAGAIMACTGMVMVGLWTAVRELRNIAQRLGPSPVRDLPTAAFGAAANNRAAEDGGLLAPEGTGDAELAAQLPAPPWLDEGASRDRAPAAPQPVEPAPALKPRRNLLFSSSSRRERERAQARTADPSAADLRPPPAAPPSAAEPSVVPPATFDDAWPRSERARAADAPPRRSARAPSTFTDAASGATGADRYPPAAPSEDQPPVTVLKSGVVDGMAYSLYSDGSIEAQMPEGMMRFASIDELRAHLEQRP